MHQNFQLQHEGSMFIAQNINYLKFYEKAPKRIFLTSVSHNICIYGKANIIDSIVINPENIVCFY